jgi:dipeptidyl aminopeptidase/acylaminoacyl peptidase
VDEERRQIWFQCSGIRPEQDPYHVHLARINFDGSGLVVLTTGDGNHALRRKEEGFDWRFSPDGRWFVATYSRADLPPVTELRRTEDGGLVCALERADASEWTGRGVRPPVRFWAKGRDGVTDVHGLLVLPSRFDSAKKYPVIEEIYAGPHGAFVPKEWGGLQRERFLAELGFIVVRIDGMGTNWRSRAFHDVAWKNLKDAGFPDRIAWMRAAAAAFPQMDLSRVGVFGGSAGGQNALSAVLHHGAFYKAAAADCGCHDNRMDKIWWNEAWMGWPVGPEYAENSNVTHAAKLQGKLLLSVGELDRNVDPASTFQVVRALITADKDFELLVVPGGQHGVGEQPYAERRRADFFVRHLLGVEPRWH